MSRIALVLFNLGGPDGPKAVRPFLYNLFKDSAIIGAPAFIRYPLAALISSTREKSAQANYARMGGGSPILPETTRQAEALEVALSAMRPQDQVKVFIAMRYWKPFTKETAVQVAGFAPDEIVLLPLYPQFSTTTSGSSLKAWHEAYQGPGCSRTVCCYPISDGVITAHVNRINAVWEAAGRPGKIRLLFSAHGLPEKVIEAGDPYQVQVDATAAAIAARLPAFQDWRISYQSRVGPLKWIGPSTDAEIRKAGEEGIGVLIDPIAFVSEHIETLVELDHEYGELAHEVGCSPYLRAPALGVEPAFIGALASAAMRCLGDNRPVSADCGWVCPADKSQCAVRCADKRA
ncbi:MAG: ferrochelatase [Phenylobacterium zucineum]|nr:MAG: ferrochelatase [Phenylobacterium zucineum]